MLRLNSVKLVAMQRKLSNEMISLNEMIMILALLRVKQVAVWEKQGAHYLAGLMSISEKLKNVYNLFLQLIAQRVGQCVMVQFVNTFTDTVDH